MAIWAMVPFEAASVTKFGRVSSEPEPPVDQHGRVAPPGVIEVYPHPALVELAGASERLPYIASKVWSCWPSATQLERLAHLRHS